MSTKNVYLIRKR